MPNWMSLRAYARHRGDALSAVQKAIATKRIPDEAVRRNEKDHCVAIDQELADRQWALNTDPAEALKNGKNPSALLTSAPPAASNTSPAGTSEREPAGGETEGPVGGSDLLGSSPAAAADDDSYLEARTREKQFQAKKAELDYLERVGDLVSADAIREEQFDIYRQHRDKLEQIPSAVAEKLAAETDPQRIEHLLRTEIRNTLNELSRAFAEDAVADGAAERTTVTA